MLLSLRLRPRNFSRETSHSLDKRDQEEVTLEINRRLRFKAGPLVQGVLLSLV